MTVTACRTHRCVPPGHQRPAVRVLALTRYSAKGPSSRLRFAQFVAPLAAHGFTVELAPFFSDDYVDALFAGRRPSSGDLLASYARRFDALLRGGGHDLLWIEKELFPFLPGIAERMTPGGIPFVVDYDDAVFHRYDRHRHALVRRALSAKFDPLLAAAHVVMVGNEYLAGYARGHGARRVVRLPTVVDPGRYPTRRHDPAGPLRIGWIGTPANTTYLKPVIKALQPLAADTPLTLVTIGAGDLDADGIAQERHNWSEAAEGPLLATCDLGVMPLPDSDFERGKCGYKLIQYMAAGLPVIASPVGVNAEIVTLETGFLAARDHDWRDAVRWFADNRDRLAAMGRAARARIEAHYSIGAATETIAAEFRLALG